jgi:DNA-binding CsgD family transcriptional regulator
VGTKLNSGTPDMRRGGQTPATMTQARSEYASLANALDVIGGPALIVDPGGGVLRANAAARALLARDGQNLTASLAKTIAGTLGESLWQLTALRETDNPPGFLALLKAPTKEETYADAVNEVVGTDLEAPGEAKRRKLDDAILHAARLWKLTRRQKEVFQLLACGLTNTSLAEMLDIGERAVEYHVSAILVKAGAENRTMLIAKLLDL